MSFDLITKIMAVIGLILGVNTIAKDFFGVTALGKKIYKGAPWFWKRIMRNATHRKEVDNRMNVFGEVLKDICSQLSEIRYEVKYNGDSSMKDAVRRIENLVIELADVQAFIILRLDANDVSNGRMAFHFTKEKGCTFINEIFLRKFGYAQSDVLGYSFTSLIDKEDIEEALDKWDYAFDSGGNYYDEQKIYAANGQIYNCCVRGTPYIVKGNLIKYYGTIDIIEPKK